MNCDLISRSALLEKEWLTEAVDGYPIRVIEIADILDAPAVEARPVVHAKWEQNHRLDRDGKLADWFRCSECYEDAPIDRYGQIYFSKYCPRCGSQMTLKIGGKDE